jgi:hypothetical protein
VRNELVPFIAPIGLAAALQTKPEREGGTAKISLVR